MRIRMMLAALVAVFAVSAAAAGSASAVLPELVLKAGKTFPVKFHSLLTLTQKLETVGGTKVECSVIHTVGQWNDAHLGEIHILFLGCSANVSGATGPCGNKPASASKEILLEALFHLGYTKEAAKEVGILIDSHATNGVIVKFECEILFIKETIEVKGGVIGTIPNAQTNGFLEKVTLSFEQVKGVQKVQEITLPLKNNELMVKVHLESKRGGNAFEEAGEESLTNNVLLLPSGETAEIKA